MSKEGCLSRIALYKGMGNTEALAKEEAFFAEHYGKIEAPEEKPKVEKTKKSKAS